MRHMTMHTITFDEDKGKICVWRKGDRPTAENWFANLDNAAKFVADVMITTGDDRLGFTEDVPESFDKVAFVHKVKWFYDHQRVLH